MLCLECGNSLRDTHQLAEKALETTNINITEQQCRICLKDEVFFEGTEVIFEFYGPTYKECYYQFTQPQKEGKHSIFFIKTEIMINFYW